MGFLQGVNEITLVESLAQCLAHSKPCMVVAAAFILIVTVIT